MTTVRDVVPAWVRFFVVTLHLALAACGLPQPFAGADGSDPVLTSVLVNPGVLIAPVIGAPPPMNQMLAEELAASAQQRDVAAVTRGAARSISLMQGRAETETGSDGLRRIRLMWELRGPDGLLIDSLSTESLAFQETASDPWLLFANSDLAPAIETAAAFLAVTLARDGQAGPSGEVQPVDIAFADVPYQVRITPLSDAPGDGGAALSNALRTVLMNASLPLPVSVVGDAAPHVFEIGGRVALTPTAEPFDVVAIRWEVRLPSGDVLGTVAQENAVPAGSLNGQWGDNAVLAAEAAADGILQLLYQFDPLRPGETAPAPQQD